MGYSEERWGERRKRKRKRLVKEENEKSLREGEGRGSTVQVHFFNTKKCLFIFKIYLFKCKNAFYIYIY